MGLRINTNTASLIVQRSLTNTTRDLNRNFQRLATGLRITSAADDAAGLGISERLRAQIRSLDQAGRNANQGVSLLQTAEGSLGEVSDILIRLRELAVQSSNGTTSTDDQETLDAEFQSLVSEVDRIGASTEFAGISLFDGSASNVTFQVGT
ncbi:MAG: flagellin N-terminal helical domain-containing protein, partial [Planctomycetota bacterium]